MTNGTLVCTHCGKTGALLWVEDGRGGTQAQLPAGFHLETRPGLGRVVICDYCDEIMLPPSP
jgi:hypothetical protein